MGNVENYYELLGLDLRLHSETLSPLELKAAYRRALLRSHPDKKAQQEVGSKTTNSSATVDDVAVAYKTLSEPKLRAEYDRWLQSNTEAVRNVFGGRPHHTGLETVDLDDLLFDSKATVWTRSCRCGDDRGFIVAETELEKNAEDGEVIVGCKGCSLWLRVLFSVER